MASSAGSSVLRLLLALLAVRICCCGARFHNALAGRVVEMEQELAEHIVPPPQAAAPAQAAPPPQAAAPAKGDALTEVVGRIASLEQGDGLMELVERIAGPQRSIIVACVAENYIDMAKNWAASVQRFGYGERILFIADDAVAHAGLLELWPKQTVFPSDGGPALQGTKEDSGFGTPFFNSVVWQKPFHIRKLLDLNVSVFYNDVDIVWVANPYPHLHVGDFDAVIQRDTLPPNMARVLELSKRGMPVAWSAGDTPCTGSMFFPTTAGAKKLVDMWRDSFVPGSQDQQGFGNMVGNAVAAGVKLGMLPVTLFPSGCLFFQAVPECANLHAAFEEAQRDSNSSAVMVHANWMTGHAAKMHYLKTAGLWRPEEAKGSM